MKKYELSEFKEKLVTEINIFLEKIGCGYQAVLKVLPVNGEEKEVILFEDLSDEFSDDDFGSCCFEYLELLHSYHMSGYSVFEIAKTVVRRFFSNMKPHRLITAYLRSLTKEEILKNISVRLVSGENCSQNGFSYVRTWNDLSVALDMKLNIENMDGRLLVTDELLERYDISPDAAYEVAFENVKEESYELFDYPTICKWLNEHGVEISDTEFHKMYLYTNAEMHYGTKMIFNKQPLRKLAEKLDSDLYLCASSVREWIVVSTKEVPVSKLMDIHKFMQNNLEQKERLSDSIYIYRRDYDNIGRVSVMKLKKEV